jgi:hypothetical protein
MRIRRACWELSVGHASFEQSPAPAEGLRGFVMYADQILPCPICADATLVEAPPCNDGHGSDCPDRACTGCGAAVVTDPRIIHALRPAARRAA